MITKQEFEFAAETAAADSDAARQMIIKYKSYIQKTIDYIATIRELNDANESRINQGMIDKLCQLAKNAWLFSVDARSLYYSAMAVAALTKDYQWGTQYTAGDGLWEIADRIQKAKMFARPIRA